MSQTLHSPDSTGPSALGGQWLPAFALILLVAIAYWPGRSGGFVFDDFPNIVDNTQLHVVALAWRDWIAAIFSSDAGTLQRPLAMLTLAINHYFTGLDPIPMKLTNIAIHALNAILVLVLVRRLLRTAVGGIDQGRREWAARFAAAAWALHPINLMAVLFVVQRMESLAHTFVFAGLWLYLIGRNRQREGRRGWPWIGAGVLGGAALGMLSKESAALLPLYALCLEWCLFGFRRGNGRDVGLIAFYILVLIVPAILGLAWVLPGVLAPSAWAHRDYTLVERLLTEARVVLDYLYWSLFPSLRELSLYHDDYQVSRGLLTPAMTLPALLGLAALLAIAGWLRRRRPLASLGLLWFLGAQLMTATIIPLELVYEHRNYFASLGVCLVLTDLLLLWPRDASARAVGALLATVVVMAFLATTHLRAREWSNPYRFVVSEAAKHPHSPRASYDLARTLVMLTDYRPDSPQLKPAYAALAQARNTPGSGILAHSASLMLAARSGGTQDPAWWRELQERLRADPIGPQEVNALASLTQCARDGSCRFPANEMLASYLAALAHGPHPDVLTLYGDYALNVLGDTELALRLWQEACARRPSVAQYRVNLVKLLIALGQYDAAQQEIAGLRALGRYGQNEAAARALDVRLQGARNAHHGPLRADTSRLH